MTGDLQNPLFAVETDEGWGADDDALLGNSVVPDVDDLLGGEVPLTTNDDDFLSTLTATPSATSLETGPKCVHCNVLIGNLLSTTCDAGLLHNECVAAYRKATVERCAFCNNILRTSRKLIGTCKLHPECVDGFKSGKAYIAPRKAGFVKKFSVGRSTFGRKNWQERFMILSQTIGGLAYFESEADAIAYENGSKEKPPKGTVALSTASSRIISMPTFKQHPKATSASKELIVIFQEGGKERKLLLQFQSWDERCAWLSILETYVHNIDDLNDYE